MAEELKFSKGASREKIYEEILPQIKSVIAEENDQIANLANIAAILKEALGFLWIGFYRAGPTELILGPFQGPLACTRIGFGKGVCGSAWKAKRSLVVPRVADFEGHISCSTKSKSEIVIPFFNEHGEVTLILDIDSEKEDDFSDVDVQYLEKIREFLS
jgi:L-methionine (R)-S-oxide reductase